MVNSLLGTAYFLHKKRKCAFKIDEVDYSSGSMSYQGLHLCHSVIIFKGKRKVGENYICDENSLYLMYFDVILITIAY